MRYEGTRPSGVDKEVMVYKFVVNKAELDLIKACVDKCNSNMPATTETQIVRHRLSNISKVSGQILQDIKNNKI